MPRGINQFDEDRLDGLNVGDANSSNIVSPGIVTDGLVLHLDAGNYQSYPIAGTTWYDLSDRRNNGTLTNGPTYARDGGGAISFDGANDYVNCGSNYLVNRPFSINSWVYYSSLTGFQMIVGQDTSAATLYGAFYWGKTTDTPAIPPRTNNTFGLTLVTSSFAEIYTYDTALVTTGVWYNYSVSVDSNNIVLYKNGLNVATTSNSDTIAATSGNLLVGAAYYNNTIVDYFTGRNSINSFYNRALTPTEVAQNFNALRARFNI